LSAQVSINAAQMTLYYIGGLMYYYPKDGIFGPVYDFANTTDALQKSTNVKLKLSNSVFYNEKNVSQQFLDDLVAYHHSELYKVSFESQDNETALASFNDWISKKTNGRGQKIDQLTTRRSSLVQISVISFTGCWDKQKNSANIIKTLKFKNAKEEITTDALYATEKIGYYNNTESKYEVIKLPYKNGEIAMAIVLPYPDQQLLDVFKKPNNEKAYHQIFDQINSHEESIEYTVPVLNLGSISLNEKGTEVNGDNPIVCDTPSAPVQQLTTSQGTNKQFYVNRPFAVFIYDVKTKYVLVHALVKTPTSKHSSVNILGNGQKSEPDIRVSNLYELFNLHA
ncbi:serpin family protein, partial [Providencia sp. PROV053]|uniref:serpin family protein n=2 Tax=unclassified Providencia TaxID=2633465 RepID=UPI00234B32CA